MSEYVQIPAGGETIQFDQDGRLNVPNKPIIPYIEGDGIGVDISPVMLDVVNAAVKKAYAGAREIQWMEVFAGEKATRIYGANQWLPVETLNALKDYVISIKGPLTTPIGGGIRSLNVAIRQTLDLYVCLRPVRYLDGTPSPMKRPELVDIVLFRENSEGIYAGIEWPAGSQEALQLINYLKNTLNVTQILDSEHCGIGIKPTSEMATKRLVRHALQYAIDHDRDSVTLVHKGNIQKYTEGAFRDWGYELARQEFGATLLDGGPWQVMKNPHTGREIVMKDVIADAFLQQILLRPDEYDVIATMNLNGDYLSDAIAAQVGGIGIAPGANIGDQVAVFEATHGTAPKRAGQNTVNPSSLILSAVMMLQHMGWDKAADLIEQGLQDAISAHEVTYDFSQFINGVEALSTSDFGQAIIRHMV